MATNAANRFGQDYAADAAALGRPVTPIIDVHSHINGAAASKIFARAAELYGVERIYSMSRLADLEAVRAALGDRIRFIAIPDFRAEDKAHAFGRGYLDHIRQCHDAGARMTKFWVAPRGRDFTDELGGEHVLSLDSPLARKAMDLSAELGMMFMTHVADPDTWFQTSYVDASKYGTKREQYEPLERVLEAYPVPWIAAHMGGWPEDLHFLTDLLARHDNLYLDASACKWMVREISQQPREELVEFMTKHRGRIMFGSDIVTMDDHLQASEDGNEMNTKASSDQEAFDLYASRYWALRTMWETDHVGESPIADPDLHMVDPDRFTPMDAPKLVGKSMPEDILRSFYHDAAHTLVDAWYDKA
ncbi:MAG: hypothetical protein AAF432_05115 [Planctomycetota bacterium]